MVDRSAYVGSQLDTTELEEEVEALKEARDQRNAPEPEEDAEIKAALENEGLSEEELDDLDLDSQEDHTEEDEDVFKPTDVVSYQQSVPFPVDI